MQAEKYWRSNSVKMQEVWNRSVYNLNVDNVTMEVSNVLIFVPPLDNVSSSYEKLRGKK